MQNRVFKADSVYYQTWEWKVNILKSISYAMRFLKTSKNTSISKIAEQCGHTGSLEHIGCNDYSITIIGMSVAYSI